ncbi:MAG: mechanosensitive ion channel domain-containing protein [Hyphomicrobiales bacterium]
MKFRVFAVKFCALVFISIFAVGYTGSSRPVLAQESTSAVDSLQPFLEKARESGATVIVVDPSAKPAEPPKGQLRNVGVTSEKVRAGIKRILGNAGNFFSDMGAAFDKAAPGQGRSWILMGILLGAAALAIGYWIGRMADQWGRNSFAGAYNPNPIRRSEKVGYLLFRALMLLVMAAIASGTAALIVLAIAGDNRPVFITAITIVGGYAFIRMVRLIFLNLLAPDVPSHRVINMSDEDATGLYKGMIGVYSFAVVAIGICIWMAALGLSEDAHTLALITASFLATLMVCGVVVRYRKAVAGAIMGFGEPERNPWWVKLIAKLWHVLAIAYFLFAWTVSAVRQILDLPAASGLIGAPITVLVAALGLYGVLLFIIDKSYSDRLAISPDESDTEEDLERQIEAQTPVFKSLAESAAGILVTVVALFMLAGIWGVDVWRSEGVTADLISVIIILFLAYIAYQAVKAWIDREIAREEPALDGMPSGDAEMGTGSSRIATLLPIFRNFLLITILVLAGMMTLAELGVNIGPLFASAGVIGLAIGFGAQTLIRDIFSGAFFLMDDAFRKGEYIDIGTVKGTVEKISIRSFQLRHHNGPLNTVPFGEIRHLTNFSRDWVLMKLKLRVTYDTDVEQVRRLIKGLGQELLDHPELGEHFLQPLKSQGVYSMEDSAMIIRVKFMTKPGDQFLIRKLVYERIRELFGENGIKFAHKEVTVRIADEEGDEEHTEREKKAATGAARASLDADAEAAGGAKPKEDAL